MIVSPKYRYVFVELPHTGTTAIAAELIANYDGRPVLRKHAYYHEFLTGASADERSYFAFSGIRHPMDVAVTKYFKYKTNHEEIFTDPKRLREHGGHVSERDLEKYRFIQAGADFGTYFLKFYDRPYDNWSHLDHGSMRAILRYEHLNDDFRSVLHLLGIAPVQDLPVVNRTSKKDLEFQNYYEGEDVRRRAVEVFGPFMREWGYSFPDGWPAGKVPWSSSIQFYFMRSLRQFYRKRVQRNRAGWARAAESLLERVR